MNLCIQIWRNRFSCEKQLEKQAEECAHHVTILTRSLAMLSSSCFLFSGCCLTTLSPDKDDWRDPPPLPMPGPDATRVRAEAEFVFLFETSHVNQALAIGTTNGIDVGYYVYFSYSVKTTQHVHLCSPRVLSGN